MTGSFPQLRADQVPLSQGMPALPPARDFLMSAGFGGAGALLAAIILAAVVILPYAARPNGTGCWWSNKNATTGRCAKMRNALLGCRNAAKGLPGS